MRTSTLAIGLLAASVSPPQTARAADCTYILGFKALHDLIPSSVGNCLVDEHHNPTNGDGLQETVGAAGGSGTGLLVWRKADNWTAYTDGYHTWVNGPVGLQQRLNTDRFAWEGDYGSLFALPLSDLPPGFTPDLSNTGPWTNENVAQLWSDPVRALRTLQANRRLGGYRSVFRAPAFGGSIRLVYVESVVSLYADVTGAHALYMGVLADTPSAAKPMSAPPFGDESDARRADWIADEHGAQVQWTSYSVRYRQGRFNVFLGTTSQQGETDLQASFQFARIIASRLPTS